MFKTPAQYAAQLLALHYGNKDAALAEVFTAARAHSNTPTTFWRDVFLAMETQTTPKVRKTHRYRDQHDAHVKLWGAQMVTRHNLMSGKPYQERRDTPVYLSPSSETYWSM